MSCRGILSVVVKTPEMHIPPWYWFSLWSVLSPLKPVHYVDANRGRHCQECSHSCQHHNGTAGKGLCGVHDNRRTFSGGGPGGAAAHLYHIAVYWVLPWRFGGRAASLELVGSWFLTFSLGRIECGKELCSEGFPGGRGFYTVGSRCPVGYYLGEACGLGVASATQLLGNLGYVETGVGA